MKKNLMNKFICGFLIFSMIATAVPAHAEENLKDTNADSNNSPISETFNEDNINPEFNEWVKDKDGPMPPLQDMSYLYNSFSQIPSTYSSLPEKYDLRDYGAVEPVYDQGEYGYCWSVAANVAASSPLLKQFPQCSFSPVHTTWFSYRGNEEQEYIYTNDPYKYGGFNPLAVGTMAAWKGPVYKGTVPEDPYNDGNPDESMRFKSDYHLQDSYYLPLGTFESNTVTNLNNDVPKKIIMETGAISMQFRSDYDGFNFDTSAWYNYKPSYADHQVVIVGWDDNYSRLNFLKGHRPKKNGAWLVRNSWGTNWGDDGYFWISYEDKTMGISSAYVVEENDNYKNNYQYDTMGWTFSISPDLKQEKNNSGKAANIFKSKSDEILEAVSFYTTDIGTEYTISIYTGVKKNKPESGNLILTQEGSENYPGYHTIELDKPVKLNKNSNFSIVVNFVNPEYPYAIPVEMFIDGFYDQVPKYLGNGGESYIVQDGKWTDIAGFIDGFYVTNACIKGFTNPAPESKSAVPTVRFSEMEGPLSDGTELELSAMGADEIYYSFDNENYMLYEGPLSLSLPNADSQVTVSAYAVTGGSKGNVTDKTYTKATAQLTDFAINDGYNITHFDTEDQNTHHLLISDYSDSLSIMAQSCDEIYLNDEPLESSEWAPLDNMENGDVKKLNIKTTANGKESSEYNIILYKEPVTIDFINETISYNEDKFTLTDSQGKIIKSGSSITSYADKYNETVLNITAEDGGEFEFVIPTRMLISEVRINYKKETTKYSYSYDFVYSNNPDMSNAIHCNDKRIKLEPGTDLYLQMPATEHYFRSNIFHLVVPDRAKAPELIKEEVTSNTVKLKKYTNARYSLDGEKWQKSSLFENLDPNTEYTFYVYKPATAKSFASEIVSDDIKTLREPLIVGSNSNKDSDKNNPNTKNKDTNSADTGDTSDILLWLMLILLSANSIYFIKRKSR